MMYRFHTNLNKNECIKRLSDTIRSPQFFDTKILLKYAMVGKINGDTFYFEPKKMGNKLGAKIMPKKFIGKFEEEPNGTNISGQLTNVSNMFITIFVVVIALLIAIPQVKKSGIISAIIFLVLIIGIGFIFYRIRETGQENIDFIKDTFRAHEVI